MMIRTGYRPFGIPVARNFESVLRTPPAINPLQNRVAEFQIGRALRSVKMVGHIAPGRPMGKNITSIFRNNNCLARVARHMRGLWRAGDGGARGVSQCDRSSVEPPPPYIA